MRRAVTIIAMSLALVASACGASGDSGTEDEPDSGGTDDTTVQADEAVFGEMDDPICGEGDFTVDPDEAGGSPDVLRIGVPNDRTSDIRPGLNKDMWDASNAFAAWCNEQGGIGGLQIEVVDVDAGLFNVEAAMTTACNGTFAMVGGGLAQDQLEFSGKPESDFHQCGMIEIPGYANSPEKADSNGQVQPIPNPGSTTQKTWFEDFAALYPEDAEKWEVVWGDLPSLGAVADRYEVAVSNVDGMEVLEAQSYPPTGADDWAPYIEKLKEGGATSFTWVGESGFLNAFLAKARQLGWEGRAILETNMYDPIVAEAGEPNEGTVIRTAFHPLEEASEWPAVQGYLDMLDQYVDDAKIGALGMQSLSAWLLFATAANACGEANDGVLDRTCILEQAAEVEDWTGGGLHAPQDPARFDEAETGPCSMLVIVEGGEFKRLYPEVDGDGDDVDGFHCPEDGVVPNPGGADQGNVDPDRPI